MKKNILILVLLAVIVVLGYFVWSKEAVAPTGQPANLIRYEDKQYGFSFDYPTEMVKSEDKIFLPGPVPEAVPAIAFTRVLKEPHPLMSGEIEPTTNNPKISVAVLQGTVGVVSENFVDYERIGPFDFRAGVEGEGIIYRLIGLTEDYTLLVSYNFIDENNVLNYKNVSGYLTLTEQEQYVQDILKTIKIGTID